MNKAIIIVTLTCTLIAVGVWCVLDLRVGNRYERHLSDGKGIIHYAELFYSLYERYPSSIEELSRWGMAEYGSEFEKIICGTEGGEWYILNRNDYVVKYPYLVHDTGRGRHIVVYSIYDDKISSDGWYRRRDPQTVSILIRRVCPEHDQAGSEQVRSSNIVPPEQ
jgi:hypothetical protein